MAEFLPKLPEAATISVVCYQPEARLPLSLAWTLSDALGNWDLGGAWFREVNHSSGWGVAPPAAHHEFFVNLSAEPLRNGTGPAGPRMILFDPAADAEHH